MLRVNYQIHYGSITIFQESDKTEYTIDIHSANALCAFIYHYEENGKKYAQLQGFLADEQHIKNCLKEKDDLLQVLFAQKVVKVRLNLYHKQAKTLLKYIIKKHNVECYYEEEKEL